MIRIDEAFLKHNSIGFLRLALASLVLFTHSFALSGVEPPGHMQAKVAVEGFFFLSGVLITNSLLNSASVGDYLWRRSLRIFPGLWVCLSVTAFAIVPLAAFLQGQSMPWRESVEYVLRGLFMVKTKGTIGDVFAANPYGNVVNGSLWTLPLEYLCYLVLGVLGTVTAVRRRWPMLAILAIFYLWLVVPGSRLPVVWKGAPDAFTEISSLELYTMFAVGTVAYLYRDRWRLPSWTGPVALAAVLFIFAYESPAEWFQMSSRAIRPLVVPIALLWLAAALPLKNFAKKNDLSYGAYIYAFPVQQLLWVAFRPVGWAMLAVSTAVTMGLAFLSWKLVEDPLMTRYKRRFSKRPPAPTSEKEPAI